MIAGLVDVSIGESEIRENGTTIFEFGDETPGHQGEISWGIRTLLELKWNVPENVR